MLQAPRPPSCNGGERSPFHSEKEGSRCRGEEEGPLLHGGEGPPFCDAHIHLARLPGWEPLGCGQVCAVSHSPEEDEVTARFRARYGELVKRSCGIHPQNPDPALFSWLEEKLLKNETEAIGEAGFDLFTAEYRGTLKKQEAAWQQQALWAVRFQKPLVVHCRKSLDRVFRDARLLSKCPAVVFHAFPGSPGEGKSFLKRGVNAYFSFGKELLKGRKQSASCVEELPAERILAETDAPWQRLRGEKATAPTEITRVYDFIAKCRALSLAETKSQLLKNFLTIFSPRGMVKV